MGWVPGPRCRPCSSQEPGSFNSPSSCLSGTPCGFYYRAPLCAGIIYSENRQSERKVPNGNVPNKPRNCRSCFQQTPAWNPPTTISLHNPADDVYMVYNETSIHHTPYRWALNLRRQPSTQPGHVLLASFDQIYLPGPFIPSWAAGLTDVCGTVCHRSRRGKRWHLMFVQSPIIIINRPCLKSSSCPIHTKPIHRSGFTFLLRSGAVGV
jgi:hypothetical protein